MCRSLKQRGARHEFETGDIYSSRIFVPEIFDLIAFWQYILVFDDACIQEIKWIQRNAILEYDESQIGSFGNESCASRTWFTAAISDQLASSDDIARLYDRGIEVFIDADIAVGMDDQYPVDADIILISHEIDDTIADRVDRRLLLRFDLDADMRYAVIFLVRDISEIGEDLIYRIERPSDRIMLIILLHLLECIEFRFHIKIHFIDSFLDVVDEFQYFIIDALGAFKKRIYG